MAIVYRRIFYAKAGAADQLVALLHEVTETIEQRGRRTNYRILTDYLSGRTDRVVEEVEVANLGELEAVMGQLMGDPETRDALIAQQKKLFELVDHAEVEHWMIR